MVSRKTLYGCITNWRRKWVEGEEHEQKAAIYSIKSSFKKFRIAIR